jgi:1-acyl-sn-glycerol-3-phosphate acyltransferase
MHIALLGFEGPVAGAVRSELESQGHRLAASGAECAIYLPGSPDELNNVVERGGFRRLVLRSSAAAYGASTKNPGLMTEDRVSLLADRAPEQRWLQLESIAARHANSASVRLANVLAPEEGDIVVRQLSGPRGISIAGNDPNVQFISVRDAARALAAAAQANATGLFNAGAHGAIPLSKAFRASGTRRSGKLLPSARKAAGLSADLLQYNWTIDSSRAARELDWRPTQSSVEALRDFILTKPGAQPGLLQPDYDQFGLDLDHLRAWGWWFAFLRNIYWRIESEGLENVPDAGRGLYVSNHRSFMPLDAVMHLSLLFTHRNRVPRFLIIHSLLKIPWLCNFLTRVGGVIASQENAQRLFANDELVGLFPEGIRGAFTPYKQAYKLRDFTKSGFARIAIENQAPVIPSVIVGHAEMFPIIGRIDSSFITREFGWPYLPIAPMFPLAPVPLPSKWHVRVLPPVPLQGLKPADAGNPRLVKQFTRYIQNIMQANIDDMVRRRKAIFWGKFLDGTAPARPPFPTAPGEAN